MNKVLEDMLRDFPEPFDYHYRLSADAILDEFSELLGRSSFLAEHDMDKLCSKLFSVPYILEYYRTHYLLGPLGVKDSLVQSLARLEASGDIDELVRCINRQSEIIKHLHSRLFKLEKFEKTVDSLRVENARIKDRNHDLRSQIQLLKERFIYGKKSKTKN